jgi:hypothetical protein
MGGREVLKGMEGLKDEDRKDAGKGVLIVSTNFSL